jgi:hypothetical protein
VGKGKKQKGPPNRFNTGSHGGCEALLYEFRDNFLRLMDEEPDASTKLPEPRSCESLPGPSMKLWNTCAGASRILLSIAYGTWDWFSWFPVRLWIEAIRRNQDGQPNQKH